LIYQSEKRHNVRYCGKDNGRNSKPKPWRISNLTTSSIGFHYLKIMAKRFTDTDKWKDEWYTELTSDYKIIWQYLLDTCDNAGIYKRNVKLLNYYCNTNVSAEDILKVFNKRVTQLADDKWLINKFCVYQYGNDFLESTNKAVMSAHKVLEQNGIIKFTGNLIDYNYGKEIRQRKEYSVLIDYNNPTNTLSIPNEYSIDTLSILYPYPMDTPKEQVKVKEQVKEEFKEELKETDKAKAIVLDSDTNTLLSYGVAYKLYQQLLNYEIPLNEYSEIYDDISEIGWDKFFNKLNLSASDKLKLDEVMTIKLK